MFTNLFYFSQEFFIKIATGFPDVFSPMMVKFLLNADIETFNRYPNGKAEFGTLTIIYYFRIILKDFSNTNEILLNFINK